MGSAGGQERVGQRLSPTPTPNEVCRLIKKILLIAVGLVAVATALVIYSIDRKLDDMELDTSNVILDEVSPAAEDPAPAIQGATSDGNVDEPKPEDFYVLMIGLDQRGNLFMLNTDSLIVAHVIPQTYSVKLMSIPRDQKVYPDGEEGSPSKINAVFARGYQAAVRAARENPELLSGKMVKFGNIEVHEEYISSGVSVLKKTVENHLGVPIEYSFLVHFNTVIELVDKVGGIEINVDRSMHYTAEFDGTSIHLEPGLQTLDGINALNYARHREDDRGPAYQSSDFDRGRRQQEVITALVDKIASWKSLPKAIGLLDIITSNVKTDMKRNVMASLITDFYGNLSAGSVISIPYPGEWIYPYVEVVEPQFQLALEKFKAVDDTQPEGETASESPADSGKPSGSNAASG